MLNFTGKLKLYIIQVHFLGTWILQTLICEQKVIILQRFNAFHILFYWHFGETKNNVSLPQDSSVKHWSRARNMSKGTVPNHRRRWSWTEPSPGSWPGKHLIGTFSWSLRLHPNLFCQNHRIMLPRRQEQHAFKDGKASDQRGEILGLKGTLLPTLIFFPNNSDSFITTPALPDSSRRE